MPGRGQGVAKGVGESVGKRAGDEPEPLDPKKDPRTKDGPVDGPPEEDFWECYNKRLEFPLSAVATVFLHVLVAALLIWIIVGLMDPDEDRSNPELKLMQVGGLDDSGAGAAGSGGQEDPDIERNVPTGGEKNVPLTPAEISKAQADMRIVLEDKNGKLPIAPSNAAAYDQLNKALKDKLLGVQKGEGKEPGNGFDGTTGSGPGGTGADSTRARGLRWILRFSVRGGSDYIAQLKSMGAEILIPLSSDRDCIIIPDLGDPKSARTATDADFKRLAGKIQFSDNRRQMVNEVIDTLSVRVPGQPKAFWAFFPKGVEEDLARKEKAYRNRVPENIEETVFRVTIRGGSFDMVVEDQTAKK